jgi:hypothetical protein
MPTSLTAMFSKKTKYVNVIDVERSFQTGLA